MLKLTNLKRIGDKFIWLIPFLVLLVGLIPQVVDSVFWKVLGASLLLLSFITGAQYLKAESNSENSEVILSEQNPPCKLSPWVSLVSK